ncbi:hypothetical protein BV22DRAFT_1005538 [Leucogyrophana mollusca]|uniref:Uncharacterized protein n=1 Tax=Leucogyrophana mollusca TaxID=85980 RepID=A0ACB8BTF3_9AGAM|nr:hypothetical protein BV22DRAFT_1005538 [Leucogyrophana mollusca]
MSQRCSVWASKFGIADIAQDRVQWNKDWERCLKSSMQKSSFVFEGMRYIGGATAEEREEHLPKVRNALVKGQKNVHELLESLLGRGRFDTMWLLLEEPERKKHLFHGLEVASKHSFFGEDGRAYCPEITLAGMLKERGNAYIKFIQLFEETRKSVGESDGPFYLPSDWWDHAVDDVAKPLSDGDQFVYTILTLGRNEFICQFIRGVAESFASEVVHGGRDIDSVLKVMDEDGAIADGFAKAMQSMRDKPIIRCENCERSADELGPDTRFMVCSTCKTKLDFSLHYCSQKCQKEDWQRHRLSCGKKKVSKRLPGTAGDSAWAHPLLPEFYREQLNKGNGQTTSIRSIGPGTPQYTRSPALQHQVSMIEADKDADYFLFTPSREPIRFVIDDFFLKLVFRLMRTDAMSNRDQQGVAPIAQYLVKAMAGSPGLSKDTILKQMSEEYGGDISAKLKRLEEKGPPGVTFLERMSKGMTAMGPKLMNMK